MGITIPAFGESNYAETVSNRNTRVVNISDANAQTFNAYLKKLEEYGFSMEEHHSRGQNSYAAFKKENTGIFLNYYGALAELNIAIEEKCGYFSFDAQSGVPAVSPQITQVHLVDFGMSYAIRLSDGRFIVIDGGWDFEPDVQELYRVLKEGTPSGKPVVAAWFLTHPHRDHHLCFAEFLLRYPGDVEIERVLMNYPEPDDLDHYPEMEKEDRRVADTATINRVPRMLKTVSELGIPVYEPHSGQVYRIGDAVCEILSCMDDTILICGHINPTSLVIRMELGGQVILWTADAAFSTCRLVERYGSYLKADIMQVPHHGFQSGTPEAEIAGYDLVKPELCFLPVSDFDAYTVFCTYRESSRYMMTKAGIKELITGGATRTVTLPYTPPDWAAAELRKNYLSGLDNGGAQTWVFTDLDTSCPDDFVFSFLNMTNMSAEVMIDIYFDVPDRNLSFIKATVPRKSFKSLCIIDKNDVLPNAVWFNWEKLEDKGVPKNASFAVRFISNCPVVISHKHHSPAHISANR